MIYLEFNMTTLIYGIFYTTLIKNYFNFKSIKKFKTLPPVKTN